MSLYRFNDFQLDTAARRLDRSASAVAIEPRVFDLVVYLIEHRARAIGRDELIAAVWARSDGSDAILGQAVLKARKLLGDDGRLQRCIRTVPRFGYQWVAPTDAIGAPPRRASPAQARVAEGRDADAPSAATASAPSGDGATTSDADGGGDTAQAAALDASGTAPAPPVASPSRRLTPSVPMRVLVALAGVMTFAILGYVWLSRQTTPATAPIANAQGLILVQPASVASALPDDEWLRLGVLAVLVQALRGLPGHSVIPAESALRYSGHDAAGMPDAAAARRRSGAALVITPSLRRDGTRWELSADVDGVGGGHAHLAVDGEDVVAMAEVLGERLRRQLASGVATEAVNLGSPSLRQLLTRLDATLLASRPAETLDLIAGANAGLVRSPEVQWRKADALSKLGRADEAEAAIAPLLAPTAVAGEALHSEAWTIGGYIAIQRARLPEAAARFSKAIDAAGSGANRSVVARAWRGRGMVESMSGRLDQAEQDLLRARLEVASTGDRFALAMLDADLGMLAQQRRQPEQALPALRKAADTFKELAAPQHELVAHLNLYEAESQLLLHAEALADAEAAARVAAGTDSPAGRYAAALTLVEARADSGQLDAAAAAAAMQLAELTAPARGPLAARAALARAHLAALAGRPAEAVAFAREAEAASSREGAASIAGLVRAQQIRYLVAAGDGKAAERGAADLPTPAPGGDADTQLAVQLAKVELAIHGGGAAVVAAACERAVGVAQQAGLPLGVRDVAVTCAQPALRRGDLAEVRRYAALVARWEERDFASCLLLARLARAEQDDALARERYARARLLAGQRWSAGLNAEAGFGMSQAARVELP